MRPPAGLRFTGGAVSLYKCRRQGSQPTEQEAAASIEAWKGLSPKTERLYRALFEQGVIVDKSVGMAGTDGDGLIVAPPFVITEEQIDLVVDNLCRAVGTILGS